MECIMGKTSKLQRIQQLFVVGEVVVINDGAERLPLFIAKPNEFERDDAIRDGRSARARAMLAHDDNETSQAEVKLAVSERTEEQLISELLYEHEMEYYDKARAEVLADEAWSERIEALQRGETEEASEEELDVLLKIRREFEAEVYRLKMRYTEDRRAELEGTERAKLEELWAQQYRNMVGANAFREARRRTELWMAIRECEGVLDDDGTWTHPNCGAHRERLLDGREDVATLPDKVVEEVVEVFNDLQMTAEEAGNSDAPSVSSGPLERPSKAEASTPSTPSAT